MSGMPHMPAAEGFPSPGQCESCHMPHVCSRHAVTCAGVLHVCVSVSPPRHEQLRVVVSHGLSLQRQLSCSFPPNSPPQPCATHPHSKICVAASLFHPPALLSSLLRGTKSPTRVASALQLPVLSHCLSLGDYRTRPSTPTHLSPWVQGFLYGRFPYSTPVPSSLWGLSLFLGAFPLSPWAGCSCLSGPLVSISLSLCVPWCLQVSPHFCDLSLSLAFPPSL